METQLIFCDIAIKFLNVTYKNYISPLPITVAARSKE
jgi:hypothetical protein